ncbi:MAG: hypothetical protein ABSC20_09070, partial [Candidatus Bathyarchaeia archaeon]
MFIKRAVCWLYNQFINFSEHAPACCKNGFKWYLFAFYDLKAILSATVSPIFFAVSAFFKS